MTSRPDKKSNWSLGWSTVVAWDLVFAVITGGTFFGLAGRSEGFKVDRVLLLATAPTMVAFAIGVWVAGRWAADRIRNDEFGELVRIIDPQERAAQLPYLVIFSVALSGAAAALGGAALLGTLDSALEQAAICSVVLMLVVWTFLGTFSLGRLSFRQQRQQAELRSLKEQIERAQRRIEDP